MKKAFKFIFVALLITVTMCGILIAFTPKEDFPFSSGKVVEKGYAIINVQDLFRSLKLDDPKDEWEESRLHWVKIDNTYFGKKKVYVEPKCWNSYELNEDVNIEDACKLWPNDKVE